jgi:hypothetical protein
MTSTMRITTNTNTNTMRANQLAWQHFTDAHIKRETGRDESFAERQDDRDHDHDHEESFDMSFKIHVTSKPSKNQPSKQQQRRIQWSKNALVATEIGNSTGSGNGNAIRAAGSDEKNSTNKATRRSSYWVYRDDKRHNDARRMKQQFQDIQD